MFCSFTIALLSSATVWAQAASQCVPVPAPPQTTLDNVRTSLVSVPNPEAAFQAVYAQKDVALVSVSSLVLHSAVNGSLAAAPAYNNALRIYNTSTFAPTFIRELALPNLLSSGSATGVTLFNDQRNALVAYGPGAIIVDVERAVNGRQNAVVGMLDGNTHNETVGTSSIQITVTPDNQYAFVSEEDGVNGVGNIDVFRLHAPVANGSISATAIGHLNLGFAVVGSVLSPDGCYLYATSETAIDSTAGAISVIDVETLKTDPSKALVSTVLAGCQPVRAIISSNGKTLWVTSRASNKLLAFDTSRMISDPANALIATVPVGTAPVGLTFAKNETRLLTANSNRYILQYPLLFANSTTGLSIVDVQAALAGKPAVLGTVPTGLFPREFATSPDKKTLLVTDYGNQINGSASLQTVDVSTLP